MSVINAAELQSGPDASDNVLDSVDISVLAAKPVAYENVHECLKKKNETQNDMNKNLAGGSIVRRKRKNKTHKHAKKSHRHMKKRTHRHAKKTHRHAKKKTHRHAKKTHRHAKKTRQMARMKGGLAAGDKLTCPTFVNASAESNKNSQVLNQLLINTQVQSIGDDCAEGNCEPVPVSDSTKFGSKP